MVRLAKKQGHANIMVFFIFVFLKKTPFIEEQEQSLTVDLWNSLPTERLQYLMNQHLLTTSPEGQSLKPKTKRRKMDIE